MNFLLQLPQLTANNVTYYISDKGDLITITTKDGEVSLEILSTSTQGDYVWCNSLMNEAGTVYALRNLFFHGVEMFGLHAHLTY